MVREILKFYNIGLTFTLINVIKVLYNDTDVVVKVNDLKCQVESKPLER
jgi:hypothetical protein